LRYRGHVAPAAIDQPLCLDVRDPHFAGYVLAGLFQGGNRETSDEVALERHEFRLTLRIERLDRSLVVGESLEGGDPRERHDLADDDPIAVGTKLPGKCACPNK